MSIEHVSTARPRSWSGLALAGPVAATAAMVAVHFTSADRVHPSMDLVSDYAVKGGIVLFAVSLLSMAAGLLALASGVARMRTFGRPTPVLFGLAGLAMIATLVFPTDLVPGTHSLTGIIHLLSALATFVFLGTAAVLLAGRIRSSPEWTGSARRIRAACRGYWTALGVFLVSHTPVWLPDSGLAHFFTEHVLNGILERVMLLAQAILVYTLATGLRLAELAKPGLATANQQRTAVMA